VRIRSITAPNPSPLTLDGTRTWLLGDTAIIDPGPADDGHIARILEEMPHLETILITHRHADHAPAAVPLKRATGARIIAPRGVLNEVDQRVSGGEVLTIDGTAVEVIATPGHTNEHVCYLTADGDLFTGDTVLGTGTTAIFPPDGNMADYLRSLEVLRSKRPRRIHPAHGPDRDDAVALIEEYIAHRLQRESQVIDAVANGATSVAAMRQIIYPQLDPRLAQAAEIQITAHLIKLQDEGRVVQNHASYRLP
jgi:glyoxylase-like metal-dependent hydrolase (beta-lactamase superfamily II)